MFVREKLQSQVEEQQAEQNAPAGNTPPTGDTATTEQQSGQTSAGTQNTETTTEQTVPYSRFKEINDKLKQLETDRKKAEEAQRKAEEQAEIEKGNWQKIAEERKAQLDQLTPKATLADDLTVIVTQQLDAEIAAWPESARAIVSADGLDLKAKLELVNRTRPLAQEILAAQGQRTSGTQFPPQFGGTGGNQQSSNKVLDEFRRQQAEEASKAVNPLLRK